MSKYKFVLASNSPRRYDFIKDLGIPFVKISSDIDENIKAVSSTELVERLSNQKAKAVVDFLKKKEQNEDFKTIILGADTIVDIDGEILGKPCDENEARKMVMSYSNRGHKVISGVTLLLLDKSNVLKNEVTFSCSTEVICSKISKSILNDYILKNEWKDKAGAYGIQGSAQTFIKKINGSYSNVVGLPLTDVIENLNKLISDDGNSLENKSLKDYFII